MDTLTIAKIGTWLDDPYGDGIRLDAIRNPSNTRVVALNYIEDQSDMFSEDEIRGRYEPIVIAAIKNKAMRNAIERNLGIVV